MDYKVVFAPEVEDQLAALYRYIAEHASPSIAERYTSAIIRYCEELCSFSHRGVRRDDIRPGLRVTNYEGNAVIAFSVEDNELAVAVLGVFCGGQDFASKLKSPPA